MTPADRRKGETVGELPNVLIVLAQCERRGGLFGVRIEEVARRRWVADWAFPVRPKTAEREGYGTATAHGEFSFAPTYPGCPGCENPSVFKCGCGKVSCWDGTAVAVTCPWCGNRGRLTGTVETLTASGDT